MICVHWSVVVDLGAKLLIVGSQSLRNMNLRAPFSRRVICDKTMTPMIRSRHDFRFKYGCWESVKRDTEGEHERDTGDATEEVTRGKKEDRSEDVLEYAIEICSVQFK